MKKTNVKLWIRLHYTLTGVWVLLTIPTLLWWRNSLLWVAFMSIYANLATHWGAAEAAKAEAAQGK